MANLPGDTVHSDFYNRASKTNDQRPILPTVAFFSFPKKVVLSSRDIFADRAEGDNLEACGIVVELDNGIGAVDADKCSKRSGIFPRVLQNLDLVLLFGPGRFQADSGHGSVGTAVKDHHADLVGSHTADDTDLVLVRTVLDAHFDVIDNPAVIFACK